MFRTKYRRWLTVMVTVWVFGVGFRAFSEVIFQDSFDQGSGNITNSVPFLDVQGNGWQILPVGKKSVDLDGNGHCFNAATTLGAAAISIIPIGPHGSMTLTATLQLPTGTSQWIGLGFANTAQSLDNPAGQSGPWIRVNNDGSIFFYGGAAANNPNRLQGAWTNNGTPVTIALMYDAFRKSATLATINNGTTNYLLDSFPVTNTLSAISARYVIVQFPATSTVQPNRWVGPLSVNWYPRPAPLLALPVPITTITNIAPTGDDISSIQGALDFAATNGPTEIQFESGAIYILTNNSTSASIPLTLLKATNVVVDGNGCKILIKNPHLGFLEVMHCQNVIVKGFSVDYDPLPFTQGIVTGKTNDNSKASFDFRVDDGYPMPTNDYFLQIKQWGTFMDPTRPGRLANGHSEIYDFDTVSNTAISNVFKVTLKNASKIQTITPGDIWCQLARFNGATLFRTRNSEQVTYLDLTNYTGAAGAFEGDDCPMVNEINCQVVIGPSPAGANGVPRRKTTNADGGLFTDTRIGPWVEGCYFIGMSDDIANANVLPFFIAKGSTSSSKLHIMTFDSAGGIGDFTAGDALVGDSVIFFKGTNGAVFDRATITAISPPNVTFDHSISGFFAGTNITNTLIFDRSLNTSAVYLNNQFLNSRVHGIYCRADNILVAHNFVSGMASSAVVAYPALSLAGPESFAPTNAVIMDNVLADGGWSYEATNNIEPDDEPAWALLELHISTAETDYVPTGRVISGIRILNNAFTQWARAAIDLHNVSDANIIGNYFGPPVTNGLPTLPTNIIGDLWACDYTTLRFKGNVKSSVPSDGQAFSKEGNLVSITGAFDSIASPKLALTSTATNIFLYWNSIAPAFIVQQADDLGSPPDWADMPDYPCVNGTSNSINLAFPDGSNLQFYRLRQR
jgi:hypothetical protein